MIIVILMAVSPYKEFHLLISVIAVWPQWGFFMGQNFVPDKLQSLLRRKLTKSKISAKRILKFFSLMMFFSRDFTWKWITVLKINISATFEQFQLYSLRCRGIPKSSRADMPDLCISCSFLLCQNGREYRIPCSQKCANFSREKQVQI